MIDKSFTATCTVTVVGDDSGTVWDEISHKNHALDANELKAYIGSLVSTALAASNASIDAAIASGDVAKP